MEIIWVCGKCGSEDVEEKAFVTVNTYGEPYDSGHINFCAEDDEDRYCNNCGDNTYFIDKDEYEK